MGPASSSAWIGISRGMHKTFVSWVNYMRYSHTSITVKDMDESLRFYTEILGLQPGGRRTIPENRAEIAFVIDPESGARIELTFWQDKKDLSEGDLLDHIGFEVKDVRATVERLRGHGVRVLKEPFTLKGSDHPIAFVSDPNGVWIELVERA